MKMQRKDQPIEWLVRWPMEEHVHLCREAGFPLYGLPQTYHGPRVLGDTQRAQHIDKQTGKLQMDASRIELVHGDISTSQSALQITIATLPGPTLQQLFDMEINQRQHLVMSTLSALTLLINIDGRATLFQGYQSVDCWGVQTSQEDFSISVVGLHWSPEKLDLISLDDIDPYIAGTNEWVQRQIQDHQL